MRLEDALRAPDDILARLSRKPIITKDTKYRKEHEVHKGNGMDKKPVIMEYPN
jgi:hypothetical protein